MRELALTLLFSCAIPHLLAQPPSEARPSQQCPRNDSRIHMRAGSFSSQPGVTFDLHPFFAHLVPMSDTAPGCYQAMTVVQHAVIFTSNDSLSNIFVAKLRESDSKLRDLKIVNGNGTVRLTGSMHELVPIQFLVEGPVTTDGASIRVDVQTIKADGIPIKLLLETLGKDLNAVFGSITVPGITVHGNTLLFRPEYLAHLKGHILSAISTPTGLTLTYGPPVKPAHMR